MRLIALHSEAWVSDDAASASRRELFDGPRASERWITVTVKATGQMFGTLALAGRNGAPPPAQAGGQGQPQAPTRRSTHVAVAKARRPYGWLPSLVAAAVNPATTSL